MTFKYDPDGTRLPVKVDSASNGEFEPIPISKRQEAGNREALAFADECRRKLGMDRRRFLVSASGVAATLLAFNKVNAAAGATNAYFDIPAEAAYDNAAASAVLDGDEFILDAHGHFINPNGAWLDPIREANPSAKPFGGLMSWHGVTDMGADGDYEYLRHLGPDSFVQDVFVDSDTDIMVLTFVPTLPEPLTIEEAAETQRLIENMETHKRLLLHGRVQPNVTGDMDRMSELASKWKVKAWKTYTQNLGSDGRGFFLTDDIGREFIERARDAGVNVIAVHKGLPFGPESYEHSLCTDIGVVARDYPDMTFMIYHSGFEPRVTEQGFAPGAGKAGIDSLVQSLIDNDIAPNSNVYADLGSTWRFVMQDPDQAVHVMGKLLKYVGEDRVIWGTDCIWYGSPQDQIQAFRAFQISEEAQERYGYPAMTLELKAKVLGLNAAVPYGINLADTRRGLRDDLLNQRRKAALEEPNPHFITFGPKNRREFMRLKALSGE